MNKIKNRTSHWNFRYIINRILLFVYELFNPNKPWLVKDATDLLNKLLKSNDIGLEFGSGRSTVWFSKKIKKITSIEHNDYWFEKISKSLEEKNINNVNLILKNKKDYVSVIDNIENQSLDFILVDGIIRDECALKSIPKLKSGGILVIDDVNRFLPSNSKSPDSVESYKNKKWKKFSKKTSNWRKAWLSNGVTDTLLLIKK